MTIEKVLEKMPHGEAKMRAECGLIACWELAKI